ncbi:MAG: ABC transporter ATP-binding protein/permease [Bernardetiaceae bacterium]|nr:ABC transporter ATP-binding protein/permease [Bernardetiaceae bacterium]
MWKSLSDRLLRLLFRSAANSNSGEPTDPRQQFLALRFVPRLLRLIWRTSPALTLANVALRLLASAYPVLLLYVGKLIIDEVVRLVATPGGSAGALWGWLATELALALLADLTGRATALVDTLLGDKFAHQSSIELMEHAGKLDLYQFEEPKFYDKLEKARQQTNVRSALLAQLLAQAQDAISIVAFSAGLVVFNPWLLVILLVAVLPSFLGESHFNSLRYALYNWWTPQRREIDYIRYVAASDATAKEVKTFSLSGFLIDRYRALSERFYQDNRRLNLRSAAWGGAFFALGTLAYYGAYVLMLQQALQGQLSVGDLTFLAGSFRQLRGLLQSLLNRLADIAAKAMYLQDYFDFFDIQPQIVSRVGAVRVPRPLQSGFVFENVSFQYAHSEKYALKNLSFTLPAGEKLALVGENGAGKTTLTKLLARLYEPTEGRILLDGQDLRDYDLNDLRENIGIIFQDFVRFSLTARENIAVGNIGQRDDLGPIQAAAQKSLADLLIAKLPKGYDQMLGKRFNDGVELSGGEWQKVAIARAYLRNAQLLILDEPTSALDARAEHEVFVRFAELIAGRSAVLISHRFSTVRMADRILFLEQGMLKEIGSHAELLALDGKYAELFRLQAKGYQ